MKRDDFIVVFVDKSGNEVIVSEWFTEDLAINEMRERKEYYPLFHYRVYRREFKYFQMMEMK